MGACQKGANPKKVWDREKARSFCSRIVSSSIRGIGSRRFVAWREKKAGLGFFYPDCCCGDCQSCDFGSSIVRQNGPFGCRQKMVRDWLDAEHLNCTVSFVDERVALPLSGCTRASPNLESLSTSVLGLCLYMMVIDSCCLPTISILGWH